MKTDTFTVMNSSGFHVRPVKSFVQQASAFPCKVTVMKAGKRANGKSALSMLTLGIAQNDRIVLETDGDEEERALHSLGQLLTNHYEE